MEDQSVSPIYLKGFNHGYQIQQHEPELGQLILERTDAPEEYLSGFKAGGAQFEMEKSRGKDAPSPDPGMDMEK